jgi:hypothetical protein
MGLLGERCRRANRAEAERVALLTAIFRLLMRKVQVRGSVGCGAQGGQEQRCIRKVGPADIAGGDGCG